jgi:hypothetical protein
MFVPSEIEKIQQDMVENFNSAIEKDQNENMNEKCLNFLISLKLRKNYRPTAEFARFMRLSEVTIFRRSIFLFYLI